MRGAGGSWVFGKIENPKFNVAGNKILRADLIEVHNIFKGLDKLGRFFDVEDGATRGHSLKLFKRRVRLDVEKYKFGNTPCLLPSLILLDILDSVNIHEITQNEAHTTP